MVEVQFKNTRKGYFRNSNKIKLEKGDVVAVEAAPGHDIGVGYIDRPARSPANEEKQTSKADIFFFLANGKRQGVRKTAKDISEQKKQVTTDKIHTADAGDQTAVSFENVVFGYDEHLVSGRCEFEVKKGEQVTLSGRTGAGKSTILKLLLGLYEPQSGSIRIGNVSATEVPEEERRSLFGYVEQSFHMVPGTVREQITLYDRRITEKQCRRQQD